MNKAVEVVILGGSYAGISAAMALGRSLREVLVIDNGQPCNRQTPHSHNFLTRDGATPAFIASVAKEQVLEYPTVQWLDETVSKVEETAVGLLVYTSQGLQVHTKKLLLATGVKDELLPIPGFAECWGISVLHCPYCHGYEVRKEALAVLSNGEMAMEFVQLIRQWSSRIQLLTNGNPVLTLQQLAQLEKACIPVRSSPVQSILHTNGHVYQVQLEDGTLIPLKALFVRVPFSQSPLVQQLGLSLNEQGYITVNPFQQTSLAHVFAAGDCTTPMRSVSTAVAQGTMAGAAINKFLLE
ncbi:MAG: NAD(P)/FAD-dependent oxidoreductase [Flavihumibacter sp.]|jgi:thioredoxin reductase|nr:NAD(P)/FAD-dependent oxidoreductase [Flavihumibacter sp.]